MRMFQPHEVLARLSAEVPGFRIGTGILLLSMMNPVQVAEQAATLDWMTDGGYVLAAGLGYRREEFQSMGVERKTPSEPICRGHRSDTTTVDGRASDPSRPTLSSG